MMSANVRGMTASDERVNTIQLQGGKANAMSRDLLDPIALEGRLFPPADAVLIGLVHELAPAADLVDRAAQRARALADIPAIASAQVKRALRTPIIESIRRTQDFETGRWLDSWFSDDA